MTQAVNKIAIVGGGTAGWLVANHLGKTLSQNDDVNVTLIESPSIPTIGVGEGTVPMMRDTLRYFEIPEGTFLKACDATFKQSVKFVDWLDPDKHGAANFYHHLFEYPFPAGLDMTDYWLAQGHGESFADYVSFQQSVCEQGLAPKTDQTPDYEGAVAYAYHLNAKKFGQLLKTNATERFGVRHLLDNVTSVTLDDEGAIDTLVTEEHGELAFDFYVDCSGFGSLLLGKTLGVDFVDKSDQLFVDSALTVQVPTGPDAPIPPYTIATAHEAGWIWDIALPERRGVGLVYASRYMGEERARALLDDYLGPAGQALQYRKIPMPVGYRERFWEKNCVAIGLSQGFVEPLEATAILVSDFCARLLAERIPQSTDQMPALARLFNQRSHHAWDRVIDFIKLHYCLSDRADTPFWRDNRDPQTLSENLRTLLEQWQWFAPKRSDFFSKFEVFDIENYLYVLYGMRYHTNAPKLDDRYCDEAGRLLKAIREHAERAGSELPRHRDLLASLTR